MSTTNEPAVAPNSAARGDARRPRHWPKSSYDPRYDPVVDAGPGHNRDYAPTYWTGTAWEPGDTFTSASSAVRAPDRSN